MKPLTQSTTHPKTGLTHQFSERLPVGFTITCISQTSEQLDITLPAREEEGLLLTFIHYKGELQITTGDSREALQQTGPGIGLLSSADKPLRFCSSAPIQFSVVSLFLNRDWINNFMKDNENFKKIEQVLQKEENIVCCRLGRKQLTLLSSIMAYKEDNGSNLLEIQNHALGLLEYSFCCRHRSLSGGNSAETIENEDDLSLIKEVESYISEYYCSDTFTVDSILKKTYTSYHKLNFLFKSIHGMTISEYIRNKRIERSREMIADNAKSISQIAYEIGYSSISNYILAFKKIYQITPGKYKKQIGHMA